MKLKELLKVIPKEQFISVENITVNKGYAVTDEYEISKWKESEVILVEANTDDLDITVR